MKKRMETVLKARKPWYVSAGLGAVLPLLLVFCIGCGGPDPVLDRPMHLCVSPDDSKLYIADTKNLRILITDADFHFLREITHPYFYSILGMCLLKDGEIVVVNTRYTQYSFNEDERKENSIAEILIFSETGSLLDRFEWLHENGPIISPQLVSTLPDNTFLVSEGRDNRYYRMNRKGEIVASFSEFGDAPGQLYYPGDVRVDGDGNWVVCDGYNSRIQLWDSKGNFLKVLMERGTGEGQVMFPQNLCFDGQGNLYVSEAGTFRVSVFNPRYQWQKFLYPRLPGQSESKEEVLFELLSVVYQRSKNRLLVADSMNSGIHLFDKDGEWKGFVEKILLSH